MSTNLPPAWGDESEWACVTEGSTTTYLRVADFASREDARLFNKWAKRNYFKCDYPDGVPLCYVERTQAGDAQNATIHSSKPPTLPQWLSVPTDTDACKLLEPTKAKKR